VIVATGYSLFWSSLFQRLPVKGVGEEHMWGTPPRGPPAGLLAVAAAPAAPGPP
jgi:hypothetical protein